MHNASAHLVKICGLSTRPAVEAALGAGADAIGFIFATSRRQVTGVIVAELLAGLDLGAATPVGVFVDAAPQSILKTAETAGLQILQLAGDENPAVLAEIDLPVWKVMRFPEGTGLDDALDATEPWFSAANPAERILIDGAVPGQYGGTGHRADWNLARELARRYPVILAGGLSSENLSVAIATVQPFGVDTSSGVEIDGTKDLNRIAEFTASARQAFSSSSR